ncbi:MAG: beta-eliminating lyase-related protein [Acidimicrobiia bacterium]|nr:beta-eliminating lyase-related protein [Acidimicrobiia bacterium]
MIDPISPLADLAPPVRSFASDNFAGVHPAVLEAIAHADAGHQPAYGDDIQTARCAERFNELFDADVVTRLTFNGTGANILALATLMGHLPGPHHAIVCSSWAHINIDETGAPERILATKLIDLASDDGKIRPHQLRELGPLQGNVHHVQPGIVSITQPTELGALYTPVEITAICETAHQMGMLVHLDGARIANATAALGGTREALRSFTVDTGVDVLSFGGTKIGAMGAEAVVFLNRDVSSGSEYLRKQVTQLSSKMRYLAAQFNGLLADDLWIELGANANAMARSLHTEVAHLEDIELGPAPEANSMYPFLPKKILDPLQQWSFFWDWDESRNQVRWMAGWDTTQSDVEQFVGGIRRLLEQQS